MLALADPVTRISYFKRYKMEVDLADLPPPLPAGRLSLGRLGPRRLSTRTPRSCSPASTRRWTPAVFPSLGDRDGCAALMTEIAPQSGFVPEATWLLVGPAGPCGTIQGIRERRGVGAIQNVGVAAGLARPRPGQGPGRCKPCTASGAPASAGPTSK